MTSLQIARREAFAQIVARYQPLVCALAYSATGSLSESEDLARETFLTAWKKLPRLRESHKLKSLAAPASERAQGVNIAGLAVVTTGQLCARRIN